jgi:hypothetical protein
MGEKHGCWILLTKHLFNAHKVLLHAVNLWHGTNNFTSLPKDVVLRIFVTLKNPLSSAEFEPVNLRSSGKHATTRPPWVTYLLLSECSIFMYHNTSIWQKIFPDFCIIMKHCLILRGRSIKYKYLKTECWGKFLDLNFEWVIPHFAYFKIYKALTLFAYVWLFFPSKISLNMWPFIFTLKYKM